MTSRVAMLWAALIAFSVAPAHCQIGGANAEALTLSQNESDAINSVVNKIAEGVAFGEVQGKDVISSIKPYTGITPFARNGIEYQIFPTLGFFRIRSLRDADDVDWLYIAWLQKDAPVVVQKDANASHCKLSDEARKAILAVGSGIANTDLQSVEITCAESESAYVHFMRKISQNESRSISIEALARRNGENFEVESVGVDRLWRSSHE